MAFAETAQIQRKPRGSRTKAKQKLYQTIAVNLHRYR